MRKIKYVLCVMPLVLLAGCGDSNTMEVSIEDGRITTVVTVDRDSTVSNILKEAELTISADDDITPAVTEVVADGDSIVISRKNEVTIMEDGNLSQTVTIMGGTVADVLKKAGITLGEYDEIDHAAEGYVTDGMSIDIVHKIPVDLTVDGDTKKVITSAKTVAELLDEQDISVGTKDRISKAVDEKLTAGDKLVIERVNVKKITETEVVAYETQTEYSDDMYAGESSIRQEGVNGEKELTYDVTYVDGRESGRKLVSEKMITEPVDEIVVEGTKQQEAAADEPSGTPGKTIVRKEKNYDCDGSGHGWYTITYSDGSVEYIDF